MLLTRAQPNSWLHGHDIFREIGHHLLWNHAILHEFLLIWFFFMKICSIQRLETTFLAYLSSSTSMMLSVTIHLSSCDQVRCKVDCTFNCTSVSKLHCEKIWKSCMWQMRPSVSKGILRVNSEKLVLLLLQHHCGLYIESGNWQPFRIDHSCFKTRQLIRQLIRQLSMILIF